MDKRPYKIQAILVCTILVCACSMLSVSAQSPAIYSPFSMPVVIPSLLASILDLPHLVTAFLGAVPISAVFFVCMLKGSAKDLTISNMGVILVTITAFVAVMFNAFGFQSGLEHQGMAHTFAITALNLGFVMALPIMFWRYRKQPTVFTYLGFYSVFFIWFGFSALPWFGELL